MLRKRQICSPLVAGILFLLPVITVFADSLLLALSEDGIPLVVRAFFDSCVHMSLGCLAWTAVILQRESNTKFRVEMALSAIFSAGVDVDHFLAARSLNLKDALHMVTPPPFHDMSLPVVCFVVSGIQYCRNNGRKWDMRFRLLQLSTMLSVHLFRDAARRGLRVAYLFTLPPGQPFGLFPFFLPLFPLVMRCVLLLVDLTLEVMSEQEAAEDGRESPLSVVSEDLGLYRDMDENDRAMFY